MEERMDRRRDGCLGVCMGGGGFFQPRRTSSREDV